MSIKQLSTHIAELPAWIELAINEDGIDFDKTAREPKEVNNSDDLLNILEDSLKKQPLLCVRNEDDLLQTWTIRKGDKIIAAVTKYESILVAYNQTRHHRAQLGVYLRLLKIPVPQSYGPTSDEPIF